MRDTVTMPDGRLLSYDLGRVNELLAKASTQLDDDIRFHLELSTSDPVHRAFLRRIRVDKQIEEVGEAHAAIIGVEASNPRKGTTHTEADIAEELLDQALTALLAYYHVTQSEMVLERFAAHLSDKVGRYYGII